MKKHKSKEEKMRICLPRFVCCFVYCLTANQRYLGYQCREYLKEDRKDMVNAI